MYPEIVSEKISTENQKLLLDLELKTAPGTATKIVQHLKKTSRLKGFRPGKFPKALKEKHFVTKMVEQYNLIRDEKDYVTINDPELIKWNETKDGSIVFNIKAEILPNFNVQSSDYLGIEVEKDELDSTKESEAFENYLLGLEKQFGSYKPVERAAQIGDTIVINMESFIDETPLEELTFKDKQVRLDERIFGKEITSIIVGTNVDETKNIEVPLDEKLFGEKYKEKWAKVKFNLDSIKEQILHERNDDLAKMTNHANSLDELKEKFEAEHRKNQKEIYDRAFEQDCMVKVLQNINLTIPQSMILNEVKGLIQYRYQMFEAMGLPGKQAFEGLDFELLNEQAKGRLASALIFNQLCKQNDLKLEDISDDDVQNAIKTKANDNQRSEEDEKKNYATENSLKTLKRELLYDRFIKQIASSAKPIPRAKKVDAAVNDTVPEQNRDNQELALSNNES